MDPLLSSAQLLALTEVDTATMASERDRRSQRSSAYGRLCVSELKCMFPEQTPMVGYAVTCIADSSSPAKPGRKSMDLALYEALREAQSRPLSSIRMSASIA